MSPSLAAKNIINLMSVLTIWRCPCVESSLVLLEEGFVKFKIDLNCINILNMFIHYYNHDALLVIYVY